MEREQLVATVTAAQNGDSEALNLLFNTYYNDVYYFALKTLKDADLACDITQETFVEIINTIGDLKAPEAFVTWMRQVTYHQCTRYFKKKKEVLVEEDEEGNSVFDTLEEEREEFIPGEGVDKEDFRATILALLDTLSEEQRAAVLMHYYHEMSVKEIAEAQKVSEGTVKSRLNYARKSLKKSVEDYEKKNDVKLHCAGILPLLLWLFANASKEAMPVAAANTVAGGIASATGTTIALSTGGGVVTATATAAAGTGLMAKIAALPVVTKVIAGVLAAGIVIGSAGLLVLNVKNNEDPATDTTTISTESTGGESVVPDVDSPEPYFVPAGCVYIAVDGTEFKAGEEVLTDVSDEDRLITADYTYTYNTSFAGWNVIVNDTTKSTYEDFFDVINAEPLTSIAGTFRACHQMTVAPEIPKTVQYMSGAFEMCGNLLTAPEIPEGVKSLASTFDGCGSLVVAPRIPDGVVTLNTAFRSCSSMMEAPVIPDSVENMYWAFAFCDGLETAPNIPDGVTELSYTFFRCETLKSVPAIPSSVVCMYATFEYCYALEGTLEINASITAPADNEVCNGECDLCDGIYDTCITCEICSPLGACFYDTQQPIILTGSCSALYELAATGNNGNVTVGNQPEQFVVPAGCRYIMADGTVLSAGEMMPETVSDGDEFITADYTYKYGYAWRISAYSVGEPPSYWENTDAEGWSFGANDRTQVTYEAVEASINGAPVISASYAYYGCRKMKTAPIIPEGITDMSGAFSECRSLIEAPIIPQTVKDLSYAFEGCAELSKVEIPLGVANMRGTFEGCTALETAPILPDSATILEKTFAYCTNLKVVPNIPDSVVDMEYAFMDCTSLESVPRIPEKVLMMEGTFYGCSALTGMIEIDASPYMYEKCFSGTVCDIVLSGTSTCLEQLCATTENGNVKIS